jgi:hypothetical protein
MAIVDDYASIAAELRRLQAERMPKGETVEPEAQLPWHPMRATPAGEQLYRRLVARRHRVVGPSRR